VPKPRTINQQLAEMLRQLKEQPPAPKTRARKMTAFGRINGKAVKIYSMRHMVDTLELKRTKAVQDLYRKGDLPPTIIERLTNRRQKSYEWRWYTEEELREARACIALHRREHYINWKQFTPDYRQRMDHLETLFRAGDLPMFSDPEAVEYYREEAP